MKTRLVVRIFFTMLVIVLTLKVQSQSSIARVGVVKGKEGVVTDLNEASRVLKGGLSDQALVSHAWIEYAASENKYYLIGKITNDPVSGKAVQLHEDGNEVYAVIGPGVEITCMGINCDMCYPSVNVPRPRCGCADPSPKSNARCDMATKLTVGF